MGEAKTDWFDKQDADWFANQDHAETAAPSSNFHPIEDVGSFLKGAVNTVTGLAKFAVEGPVRASVDAANQLAVDTGVDRAMGQSAVGSFARRGAEAVSPVPIAPIVKVARGIGYATHLTDTPEKPSEVAESIGQLATLAALAKAPGASPDEGTTFGVKRPQVSSLIPKDTSPVNLMMRAVRPQSSRLRAPQAFETALRDLKKVEMDRGTPAQDVAGLIEDISTAQKANREQYAQLKDPKDAIGAQVDTTPVAKAMIESIPTRTRLQDPKAAAAVVQRAQMYMGSHPVDTVDTLLQEANAELESYFNKFPQARSSARTNPETASLVAEADALRTHLYKTLDEQGGGDAARELQRRYGALSELKRAAQRRLITSQTQGQDNYISAYGKVSEIGHVARGAIRLATGDVVGASLDLAKGLGTKKAADYIAAQQTPDALIRRALAVQKDLPAPIEMPQPPVIRGQLGPGAIRLGPSPEAPEPPIAQRGQYGAKWTPEPKQLPVPSSPRGLLTRGAIPVGKATKAPFYPPSESRGIPLSEGRTWFPAPDEWELLRETPKTGQLSTVETRELQRILDEMEAMSFTKKFATETGPYGQPEWHAGSGGAPVYDDILDAPDVSAYHEKMSGIGKPTRGKVIEDIKAALEGKRISRVAARAIVVARARAVGGYPTVEPPHGIMGGSRLSSPKLPPWWQE